ncbi:hypothetical protein B484DRAFT_206899 [Ochromonadaceae sp. CCMP2298]|nr:hypothetical protein B484DRAFT_206899 [Ochromonadaceae sp. CCMP2298]
MVRESTQETSSSSDRRWPIRSATICGTYILYDINYMICIKYYTISRREAVSAKRHHLWYTLYDIYILYTLYFIYNTQSDHYIYHTVIIYDTSDNYI